jgi:3-methyladenine DNA glycosylase AlkC
LSVVVVVARSEEQTEIAEHLSEEGTTARIAASDLILKTHIMPSHERSYLSIFSCSSIKSPVTNQESKATLLQSAALTIL